MTIETVYTAKDGKQFTTELECMEYETALLFKDKSITKIHLWDENKIPLPVNDETFMSPKHIAIICCETEEAWELLEELYSAYDWASPTDDYYLSTCPNNYWYKQGYDWADKYQTEQKIASLRFDIDYLPKW